MLPVSGALQLKTSGARCERPMISHSGAYSRLVRPPGDAPPARRFAGFGGCPLVAPLAVAQILFEGVSGDFACCSLRQIGHQVDFDRAFVGREPFVTETRELCYIDPEARFRRDESDDRLASIGVRRTDNSGFANTREAVENVLHLARPDLEARGGNHVLLAVDEIEPAVLVKEAYVAGMHPAAGENLGRLDRLAPVAGHHASAAHYDLPVLTRLERAAHLIDDNHVCSRRWDANRQRARLRV